jgi:hypothetical protein
MMKRLAKTEVSANAVSAKRRPQDGDAGLNRLCLGRIVIMVPSPYLAMLRELAIFHQQMVGGGGRGANR